MSVECLSIVFSGDVLTVTIRICGVYVTVNEGSVIT